ncbi:MAG: polyketide synthase, partial [Actinomycetota bacterium]
MTEIQDEAFEAIAVIGMAGCYPGARNLNEYWDNLCRGVESISVFSNEEHETPIWAPQETPWIKAKGILYDTELFDAGFFGYTPEEAKAMDPQHRLFLERGWEAIEQAGYDPERYDGSIGVFAGVSTNTYVLAGMRTQGRGGPAMFTDKDFLATRLSYKLNLTGPSVVVQSACSTSLVAVCMAAQSLLNYQCDLALAGGASVWVPVKSGYPYQPGWPMSPDGHTRAFDAQGRGFVPGSGVGAVFLKRLSEAVADGDHVWAVIKGFAVNNDGSAKIGYTAPGVRGQAEVIAIAQQLAGIEPQTVTYVEAHGTGTELGDPIEISALTEAFRASTDRNGFCAIGSVKTNIGHLDAAAGIASLQKTILALKHAKLPPSLHFERPNPKIDFASTPFYVNTELKEWASEGPRRAGVNSFGIGGTNAHVVLEEAPPASPVEPARPHQVLTLSGRSAEALVDA